ncbi:MULTISPECIES: NAD-dependent epimerase/dehydratase family protein [Bacillus]|uniref:NAD-dependent epimerase/dehydratase family protein n=1 Tax=Bacillus TaxID=1386 RepID=UPI000330FFED|nr:MULTISPECIES: NAD-dependent epimerase/dehydratase family protein [Bacillus cereus group]EOQ14807.1 glucose epimerase [Bacillus cereus VDM021]OOG91423.1 UDP-glucose 4-epimerase [Bacillus mycoides]MDF2082804.1 NAD(P)-dependent oxidoreductase [Bacillus pseudomycoides]PEK72324.1 NAD(P)-dependent oxidoreductase [Bacillus pseudomycoides]PEL24786.1 NAD(P)-dependent oxidoreductase [Bacillus pseudomycoides]
MKRVLIIGALSFVGYHLVNKMLAEEVEVYGLDFADLESMSKVSEEKLFLIGRNDLFMYSSIRDESGWKTVETDQFDAAYFCLCEPNRQSGFRNERIILQYLKRVIHMCERKQVKLNVLSSIEMANVQDLSENKRLFMKVEEEVEKANIRYSILRVPILYGPWQPSFMTYHRLILSELMEKEYELLQNENGADLLYVEDVCEYLWEKGKTIENLGVYNMISGKENLWEKGIILLNAEHKVKKTVKEVKREEIKSICIVKNTPLEFGLNKQLTHLKRYKELYEGQNTC